MSAFGPDLTLLGRLLDAAALRHRTIAANLANAETPGYRRQEVSFEDAFGAALRRGGPAAAGKVEPRVTVDETPGARLDGNNVEAERELVDLSRNTLLYETYARAAEIKTGILKSAIQGRS